MKKKPITIRARLISEEHFNEVEAWATKRGRATNTVSNVGQFAFDECARLVRLLKLRGLNPDTLEPIQTASDPATNAA